MHGQVDATLLVQELVDLVLRRVLGSNLLRKDLHRFGAIFDFLIASFVQSFEVLLISFRGHIS